jgi:GNAT superfamily N-acetyltransferase
VSETLVEPFRPSLAASDDLAAWAGVFCDGQGELSGSSVHPGEFARRMVAAGTSERSLWAARFGQGGQVVGAAEMATQPHEPGAGFLRLFVARPYRRQGIGTALLAAVTADASGQRLSRLQATVLAGPPGEPFACARHGARIVLRLERQHQRLDNAVTRQRCREHAAAAHSGFELVHWAGSAPEALAASFGVVMGHVLDAPGAALQMTARQWDAAAVRSWEATMMSGGQRLVVGAAVHLSSGQVAAATVTTVPAAGGPVADQHDTAVLPQHRGHGLARWIKADQALRLHRDFPGVREVTVTVNSQNLPMIAVNRAVGYDRDVERLLVEIPLES